MDYTNQTRAVAEQARPETIKFADEVMKALADRFPEQLMYEFFSQLKDNITQHLGTRAKEFYAKSDEFANMGTSMHKLIELINNNQ